VAGAGPAFDEAQRVAAQGKLREGAHAVLRGSVVRNITAVQCERWLAQRGAKLSASSFVQELGALNGIFEYAAEQGIVLKNPAASIKRLRVVQAPIVIPSREQFRKLIETIRESDGRALSKKLAAPGADLVELLAYSGCRIAEATSLTWADVDFAKNTLTVIGGEQGTKNREFRVVPMTGALRKLSERLKADRSPKPEERIALIGDAKRRLARACRQLALPKFSHHDSRHFFATACIESGVDIPTVSRWLGHKDGGALAMRVYGHLRCDHSEAMARKVVI
jgi:integrase